MFSSNYGGDRSSPTKCAFYCRARKSRATDEEKTKKMGFARGKSSRHEGKSGESKKSENKT